MKSDIGDLGEADFVRLCTSVGLIATKPEKDKNGWDYLVEFPFQSIDILPIDSQPSAIKCMVQVKSTYKNNGSFQISYTRTSDNW